MFVSIRLRLSLSYVLVTLITAGVVGGLTVSMVTQQLRSEEEEALRVQAVLIADEAFQHFIPFARRGAIEELAISSAVLGGFRVTILGPDHSVLADSGTELDARRVALLSGSLQGSTSVQPGPAGELDGEALVRQDSAAGRLLDRFSSEANVVVIRKYRLARGTAPGFGGDRFSEASGATSARRAQPQSSAPRQSGGATLTSIVPIGGSESPLGYISLTGQNTARAAATDATRRAVLFSALGAVLVAAAFGVFMGQGMTAGVRALTDAAGEMAKGELSTRASVRSRDEIGMLSTQFNRMAAQLETSFRELAAERDTLRRFVQDASHELRTPLTALMTFNELLRTAASADPKARDEFLTESHRQLERLDWITRSLLDLSRLEAGLVTLDLAACDAGRLVAESLRLWAESAARAGLTLQSRLPAAPVPLVCDGRRMEIALSNLLANAVRFTPPGGEITVGVEAARAGFVSFWVRDTGPGIAGEDLPHVFERFYRARNAPGSGSGLGLAIVRSIAELHGGTVTVSTLVGAGSTFRLEIPARAP